MPRPIPDPAELQICFFVVGQGDCTLIKCPTGEIYLVDCGTAQAEVPEEDLNSEYTPKAYFDTDEIFGQDKTLEGLILTHSDRDHYNWVGILAEIGVKIKRVYHTNSFSSYVQGSKYGGGGQPNLHILKMCEDALGIVDYSKIKRVTYTGDEKMFSSEKTIANVRTVVNTAIEAGNGVDQYTDARGVKVHDKDGCKISILCAGLTADESSGDSRGAKRKKSKSTKQLRKDLQRCQSHQHGEHYHPDRI